MPIGRPRWRTGACSRIDTAMEKVTKGRSPFRVEPLKYPTPQPCSGCSRPHQELYAVWWVRPTRPGDPPKERLCGPCYAARTGSPFQYMDMC